MTPNALASELLAILATIDPVSQGAGAVSTGWLNAGKFAEILAIIDAGVMTATGTIDAKFQQASDSGGTGVKDVTAKAITQLLAAGGNNRQAVINLRPEQLDVNNGFNWVRLTVTVTTAASLISAMVLGVWPRSGTASDANQAGVAQIVP